MTLFNDKQVASERWLLITCPRCSIIVMCFDSIVTTRWRVLTNDRRIIVALRVCSCWSILLGKTLCCNHVQWELNSKITSVLLRQSSGMSCFLPCIELLIVRGRGGWLPFNVVDRCSILLFLNIHRNGERCRMSPCSNRDCTLRLSFYYIR